jgi:uncharacterized protein (DUF2267 family)
MTITDLPILDITVHNTNEWIDDVAASLGWDNKHQAFQGLKITLQVLRDHLSIERSTQIGNQLPILLAGFYYRNWQPNYHLSHSLSKDEFLAIVQKSFHRIDPNVNAEQVVQAVFKVLANRIAMQRVERIKALLPEELKDLWPAPVQP